MKYIIISIVFFCSMGCTLVQKERIIQNHKNGQVHIKKIFSSINDTLQATLAFYYENCQLEKRGMVRDTIVYGFWEYYYENGGLKQAGEYMIDDSLNNGNWTYSYYKPILDKEGNIDEPPLFCSMDHYNREKKNIHVYRVGNWIFYHENGNIAAKGNYVNGWSDGKLLEYYDNGELKMEAYFDKGQKVKKWTYYYENGQIQKELLYKDSVELMLNFFLQDGQQILIDGKGYSVEATERDSVVKAYDNYLLNGKSLTYSKTGHLLEEENFKDGEYHGKCRDYEYPYDNDSRFLSGITEFYEGELHGYWIRYREGKIIRKSYFIHGKEHGLSQSFYDFSYLPEYETPWIMGKRHGIRRIFDEEGKLENLDYFYNDNQVGYIEFKDGRIIKTKIYEGEEDKFYELEQN